MKDSALSIKTIDTVQVLHQDGGFGKSPGSDQGGFSNQKQTGLQLAKLVSPKNIRLLQSALFEQFAVLEAKN